MPTEPDSRHPDGPLWLRRQAKAGSKLTVAEAWSAPYVESGVMTMTTFSELCARIEIEDMSFEACYLLYLLVPSPEDIMTVCKSQTALQRAVEGLGCARQQLAATPRSRRSAGNPARPACSRWQVPLGVGRDCEAAGEEGEHGAHLRRPRVPAVLPLDV